MYGSVSGLVPVPFLISDEVKEEPAFLRHTHLSRDRCVIPEPWPAHSRAQRRSQAKPHGLTYGPQNPEMLHLITRHIIFIKKKAVGGEGYF